MSGIMTKNIESINSYVLYFCLFLFAFVLYGNTINHSYNLDDSLVTLDHRLTSKGVVAIPEIFKSPYYEDEQGYSYEYRPVVLASFAIEHSLFGDNPTVSHFINVFLYALTSVFVFIVLSQILSSYNILVPLLTTLFFISFPLHTEAVASIKSRDELLSLLGGIGAVYWLVKFIDKKNTIYLFLILLSLTLGIFSKMSVIPFVILIPVIAILFFKPKIKHFTVLTFLLMLGAMFVIPFNDIRLSIAFFIISFILLIGFYSIYHTKLPNWISSKTKLVSAWLKKPVFAEEDNERPNISLPFSFDGHVIKRLYFILLFLVCFFLLTLGIVFNSVLITLFSGVLIAYFIYTLDYVSRTVLIIACVIYAIITSYLFVNIEVVDLVTPIVFFGLIFNRFKYERYAYCILLVYFTVFSFPAMISKFIVFGLYKLFLDGKVSKKILRISASLMFIILLIVLTISIYEKDFFRIFPELNFLILLSSIFWSKLTPKLAKRLIAIILPIIITFNLFFCKVFVSQETGSSEIVEQVESPKIEVLEDTVTSEALSLSVMNFFKSNRPLEYVEMPLSLNVPINVKMGTSFYVLGEYIKLMAFPHPMSFYYGYAEVVPVEMDNPQSIVSFIVHLILILFVLYLLYQRINPILSFAIIYYLISMFVFSNLTHPVVGMMADRFTYVASLGFCLALSYVLLRAFKIDISRKGSVRLSPLFLSVLTLFIGGYSLKTFARNALWKDPLTLMEHDIKHLNKSAQAHNLLASFSMTEYTKSTNLQLQKKYLNQGIKHFSRATEIYPDFFNAWYDLGRANMAKGDDEGAVKAFKKVLEIDSTFTNAMVFITNIYQENNMLEKSIPYYEKVIRHAMKNNLQFYNMLSYTWFRLEEYDKAIQVGQRSLRDHPNSFDPLSNLGKTYLYVGDTIKAIDYFEQAFKIRKDPNMAQVLSKYYRANENVKKANYYNSYIGQ